MTQSAFLLTRSRISYIVCSLLLFSGTVQAEKSTLPPDWQSWHTPKTPLVNIGALPGCEADVSKLPPIYQETVATYCAVKPGGPGKVAVLVRPSQKTIYKQRKGGYSDGINLLLHLKDMKILFATEHTQSGPQYHVFKESGEPITIDQADHPLSSNTCLTCHTGYSAYCVDGQCGIAK